MRRTSAFVPLAIAALAVAVPSRATDFEQEHGAAAQDCLRCHEPLKATIQRAVAHEPAARGQCVGCHAPHAARFDKLLNQRERALCATCHRDEIEQYMKGSVHTPIKNGECTSCHEVHGSENEHLLVRTGNALCTGCHQAKHAEASLPNVHEPFGEGECLDCHAAHNSAFSDQLQARAESLCQLCHAPGDAELVAAHSDIPIAGTACTGCHEPHASASKGLLRTFVHSPFGDASCEMCHLTESETPRLVRATGGRLCAPCHQDYPKGSDPIVHAPVARGECASCHVPHAGDVKGLLARPPKELCISCHQDLAARAAGSKSAHPVQDDKGACLGCHTPHSSTEESLLVSGPIRTCLACHETAKHGHPLGEDRLDPRTQQPITCVTCHDPHGTPFSYQLRGDQTRGLCIECHDVDHSAPKKKSGGRDGGRK